MPLYLVNPETSSFAIVEAGDPQEMVTRLQDAIDNSLDSASIFDLQLAGAASGLLWQCLVIAGETPQEGEPGNEGIVIERDGAIVVSAVGGDPAEVRTRLLAEIGSPGGPIGTIVIAGAGDGPTYLGVALIGPAA